MRRRLTALLLFAVAPAAAQQAAAPVPADLRALVESYFADLDDLGRRYDVPASPERQARMRQYLQQRGDEFAAMAPASLPRDARVDLWLLRGDAVHRLQELDREVERQGQIAPLLPHRAPLVLALEARRRLEPVDAEKAAALLQASVTALAAAQKRLEAGELDATPVPLARAATRALDQLHSALRSWFQFHDGYDPMFSWWARAPWHDYDKVQQEYAAALRQRLVDARTGNGAIVGEPIGDAALREELQHERIPYSPAELIILAEREAALLAGEAAKYAAELGCADWAAALELTKQGHVPPGGQPQLIKELAAEAVAFLEQRDLITIPPLAKECWRMSMMSPEAQRVSPFFLGGETIQVSFPTDAMDHDLKLQSLRSNNAHFCRATVHHELIPGHWLQHYTMARHRTWRARFDTPFWIEGWALYWEMRMYDLGLAQSAKDRIGMLYWRKHRCARIVFSLRFHLGEWTPEQCIDYLVATVGHERAAAEAEVRRSFAGGYGPLYQAAYMLGGLQLRALHGEIVGSGQRTEKQFHDAVLQQNAIPIALVRAALSAQEPTDASVDGWRFADTPK